MVFLYGHKRRKVVVSERWWRMRQEGGEIEPIKTMPSMEGARFARRRRGGADGGGSGRRGN